MSKLTEAQKEAQKRYDKANREKRNYLRSRSSARSFIRTKASYSDLQELKEMIIKKEKEMENYMYKLTATEEGQTQSEEYFNSFEDLKEHLIKNDYFSWITDDEPEVELPDFNKVEGVKDIEIIFDEFDYSWRRMEVEVKDGQ